MTDTAAPDIRVEDNGNGTFDVLRNRRAWKYDWEMDEILMLFRRHKITEFTFVDVDGRRRRTTIKARGRG